MEYRKDLFEGENIPDFALQPAKPASTFEQTPPFDATVYDRLYESLSQQVQAEAPVEPTEAEPAAAETSREQLADIESAGGEYAAAEAPQEPFSAEPVSAEMSEDEPAEAVDSSEVVIETSVAEPTLSAEDSASEPVLSAEDSASAPVLAAEAEEIATGPEAEAAAVPVHLPQKPLPVHGEEATDRQQSRKVKYTDFRRLSPIIISVEEDVLITDTKPDMVQILGAEGSCQLAERSVSSGAHGAQSMRVTGDLKVQVLYMAENDENEPAVVSLDTKVLFREDCTVKGEPDSVIALCADIQSLECERISERKFRVRAAVEISMREYCEKEMELFDGVDKEELQLLQDEIQFTDVAMRKTEVMEVSEEIKLKEGSPEIDKILCYSINLAENHKQVSGDKVMINVAVYLNVLYRSDGCPVFYRCKTEFTQFIRIDGGGFDYPLVAGRAFFDVLDCSLTVKRDEDGFYNILCLNIDVETTLEYYRQVQEPCIVDMYHYSKDVSFQRTRRELNCFCGSAAVDIPMREIFDVPDRYGNAEQVLYVSGSPKIKDQVGSQGKIVVEGVLPVSLICVGGESGKLPFSIERELEFRASLDIPGCAGTAEPDSRAVLKDIWFDQINDRQIAVNAEIGVSGYVFEKTSPDLIHTVSVTDREKGAGPEPSIIVYAAKPGDTVWKVAKKYHAPVSKIRTVNELNDREEIGAGDKILIVK